MRWLYYHKLKFLANFIRKVIRLYYSCDIYPTCQIGNGTTFYHQGLGCVFHERVVIDKDCKIIHTYLSLFIINIKSKT